MPATLRSGDRGAMRHISELTGVGSPGVGACLVKCKESRARNFPHLPHSLRYPTGEHRTGLRLPDLALWQHLQPQGTVFSRQISHFQPLVSGLVEFSCHLPPLTYPSTVMWFSSAFVLVVIIWWWLSLGLGQIRIIKIHLVKWKT